METFANVGYKLPSHLLISHLLRVAPCTETVACVVLLFPNLAFWKTGQRPLRLWNLFF